MSRILVVEDDERIRSSMRLALEDEGYAVEDVASGEEAVSRFAEEPFELVLIDLMLPGHRRVRGVPDAAPPEHRPDHHGHRPIRHPRRGGRAGGRGRRLRDQAVRGQGAGRPDPGPPAPVPARRFGRLAAQLRGRPRSSPRPEWCAGASEEVHCTRTEFRLLCELANHPGKVLSREHLLERVWGYDYFGDGRLVDVHVRRLRTKVEPDPANPRFILTVRGMGYKLAV